MSVGNDLILAGGLVQDLTIERLRVRGASRLAGGRFSGRLLIKDSDFGKAFNVSETVFSGECEFRRVRFPGEDPMAQATYVRMPTLIETKLPHLPTVKSEEHDEEQNLDLGEENP